MAAAATAKRRQESDAVMARLGIDPINWEDHIAAERGTTPPWALGRSVSSEATRIASPPRPSSRPPSRASSRIPSLEPPLTSNQPSPVVSAGSSRQGVSSGNFTSEAPIKIGNAWAMRRKRAAPSSAEVVQPPRPGSATAKTPRSSPPVSVSPVSSLKRAAPLPSAPSRPPEVAAAPWKPAIPEPKQASVTARNPPWKTADDQDAHKEQAARKVFRNEVSKKAPPPIMTEEPSVTEYVTTEPRLNCAPRSPRKEGRGS